MNTLLSIIVPIYNGEKYIRRCIDSILDSTYENLEVLLLNNRSTDSTLQILREYECEQRVKVINANEKQGLCYTRNLGIKHSTGEYITFVDADDYIHFQMYEMLINGLIKNNADIAVCNFDQGDSEEFYMGKKERVATNFQLLSKDIFYRKSFAENSYFMNVVWNKVYRKKRIEDIWFNEDLKFFEDRNFNARVMKQRGIKVITTETPYYYYYRGNEDSICNSSDQNVKMFQLYALLADYEEFKTDDAVRGNILIALYMTTTFRLRRAKELNRKDLIRELNPIKQKVYKEFLKEKNISNSDKMKYIMLGNKTISKIIEQLLQLKNRRG